MSRLSAPLRRGASPVRRIRSAWLQRRAGPVAGARFAVIQGRSAALRQQRTGACRACDRSQSESTMPSCRESRGLSSTSRRPCRRLAGSAALSAHAASDHAASLQAASLQAASPQATEAHAASAQAASLQATVRPGCIRPGGVTTRLPRPRPCWRFAAACHARGVEHRACRPPPLFDVLVQAGVRVRRVRRTVQRAAAMLSSPTPREPLGAIGCGSRRDHQRALDLIRRPGRMLGQEHRRSARDHGCREGRPAQLHVAGRR